MRILITGGAGFIGTNISLEAIKRGHEVIIMDSLVRPKSEENLKVLQEAGVEILRGDVRNAIDLQRSPIPDAIIHLAANPGIPWSIKWPSYDFDVNARGLLNVLEYSRIMSVQVEHKIPVVFASTNKVYSDLINEIDFKEGETRHEWDFEQPKKTDNLSKLVQMGITENGVNEFFPIDGFGEFPRSPYGVSKTAGDLYCQEYFHIYKVPTVVNRMSCIYGLYQKGVSDQGWIDHFIRKIGFGDGKLDIFGDGKQVRDMLWGGDVARLYIDELENIEKSQGKIFNVGGGVHNTLSLLESIEIIERLSGKKATIQFHGWRPADQKIYISDISKVKSVMGWTPLVSPTDAIQRMLDKYKEEGNFDE